MCKIIVMLFNRTIILIVILVLVFMTAWGKQTKETYRKEAVKIINLQYCFRILKVVPDVVQNYPYQKLHVSRFI